MSNLSNKRKIGMTIPLLLFFGAFANAQNPDLEFTIDSRATANGPTLNSGAFTFYANTDNPTGTTYAPYSPALTVTFSIDNPQVTSGRGIPTTTASPVNIGFLGGGAPGSSYAIINRMSIVGGTQDVFFTSSGATTGTGMAAANAFTYSTTQSNYVVTLNQSIGYLDSLGTPLTDKPYQADLTITFNRPVNNPILHLSGIGGVAGGGGFGSMLELIASTASTPITFSKLSGTYSLDVSGNTIHNGSATMNTAGPDAASGRVCFG